MAMPRIYHAVILGAPASGKGTISNYIIKQFQFNYMAMGDILRKNIELKTTLGLEANRYINGGELVPDKLVINCILQNIVSIDKNKSWLIDGFPRTKEQAIKLTDVHKINSAINLIVPQDKIIDRIKKRWVHVNSGRIYSIGYKDPKVPFTDDVTGEPLTQRSDDKPDVFRKRLETYDTSTQAVIQYFKEKGILHNFEGNTPDEIWPKIQEFLEKELNMT